MRKMVTVRTINEVLPIEGADNIELLKLDGWQCVSGKGNFSPGDFAVYFEIDAFVPTADPRFDFLSKNAITWNEQVGARIKTIKLRGELSQGLCLPLSEFPEINGTWFEDEVTGEPIDFSVLLGVEKWEPTIPAQLAGKIKGGYPSFIPKTDQERIQNLWGKLKDPKSKKEYGGRDEDGNVILLDVDKPNPLAGYTYEVTVKLDGSSMTVYIDKDGNFGVCSRNLDLIETDDNAFWKVARRDGLEEKLREMFVVWGPIAIQGELIGPGIQGNHENLKELEFRAFDIFDIEEQKYIEPYLRRVLLDEYNFEHVPIIFNRVSLNEYETIEDILVAAEGPSLHAMTREGIVFKSNENSAFSFKAISNKYLLKHGDR